MSEQLWSTATLLLAAFVAFGVGLLLGFSVGFRLCASEAVDSLREWDRDAQRRFLMWRYTRKDPKWAGATEGKQ